MTYYPVMAYRMVSLQDPLKPPTGLGDDPITSLISGITSGVSSFLGGAVSAVNAGAGFVAANAPKTPAQPGWCSGGNTPSGCTPMKGICLPMDPATLENFKELQRQTNRILATLGNDPIDVDGRIGPSTLEAVAAAMTKVDSWDPAAHADSAPCDQVAQNAVAIAAKLQAAADAANQPAVPDPASSVPSVASGTTVTHPDAKTIQQSAETGFGKLLAWMPDWARTPFGIAMLGVAGYAAYQVYKGPKKRRGRGGARRISRYRSRARARRYR